MKRFFLTLAAGVLFHGAVVFADGLKVGAAKTNITPPIGALIVGNFVPTPSAFVHDQLHARAVVIDDGKQKVALVICDLLGFKGKISDTARKYISDEIGIPASNVLISATHTHSAGSALGTNRYDVNAELEPYQHFLARRIADAVICAHELRRDAEVAYGEFKAPEHVHNRRWMMKDGTAPVNPFGKIDKVKMNPPHQSPNLEKPAGPIDPTFSFLAFREPNGDMIALYSAYSLHYVGGVPANHVSADYYGVFCTELEKRIKTNDPYGSKPFIAALANGTSGDINNIDYSKAPLKRESYQKMHEVAFDLIGKLEKVIPSLEWKKDASVAAAYQVLDLKRKPMTPELVEWAKNTLENQGRIKGKGGLAEIYANRVNTLKELDQNIKVPLQVIKIGDTTLGTFPTETFAETGLAFRDNHGNKHGFMVEIAHDYLGYLPTKRHFELGGYETWPGTNHLEPDAEEKMRATLFKMANEIK